MRVVPAVDIRGGKCVNLVQGDYARETVFAEDPLEQAEKWWRGLLDAGVPPEQAVVHVVDLDGARDGQCRVVDIVKRMSESGIRVELGGGIRTLESVRDVVDAGVVRVVLGTAAYRDPALLRRAAELWPDRIVVGEVRGGEALDMLQAMNTGHDGSLTTGHSNSPRDMISRLETMVLMAGMELPVKAIREQIASALDLIVHQARM
ncbi:MAG TPA: ATPase, T2SS/T4P/T4SS family, partial [Candidatus Hydrogenedentes bacterium]|nr:ATPase, T2SS/T4P/T4SS family [Candidatus Hydrogenedentota bacterium]